MLSLCHKYLFILQSIFISARSFLFPLCVLYIMHRSVLEQIELKYGIVLLTSYIPRIAVTLFLQFLIAITINKINAAAVMNKTIHSIIIQISLHYGFSSSFNISHPEENRKFHNNESMQYCTICSIAKKTFKNLKHNTPAVNGCSTLHNMTDYYRSDRESVIYRRSETF